jgi:hypothetical protein
MAGGAREEGRTLTLRPGRPKGDPGRLDPPAAGGRRQKGLGTSPPRPAAMPPTLVSPGESNRAGGGEREMRSRPLAHPRGLPLPPHTLQ